ncbi:molecular chaperone Hsp90 [Streptomyces sp. WMMC500]|uniref:sacsin N-terminal ATP-binding-like domain-containing protein n=1 Tax=Streptomyces sp. WMMC500 TaxID=3015154 RepID=UPI00248B4E5A|nr:molecular chaperone Hsp90 [Streptomyces sp. WMMC500]WBB58585.1 molecular chaperone Hsp90 [Streptomyces sp. WMMC500]
MDPSDPLDPVADPTARLRAAALDAWAASAARFREDANAEEDLALGGYRDRLVVELAQNAADAAARAGVPGRLRLTLDVSGRPGETAAEPTPGGGAADDGAGAGDDARAAAGVLAVANTGAPLDAAGVESLSTLRASAKRGEDTGEAVGRFGVGFSAVLAVSDAPEVVSRGGAGVRWSLAEARELVRTTAARNPALADEAARRDGHVPLLRLPLPLAEAGAPAVPEGYDTAVRLPLRDPAAAALTRRLLAGIDDALLLALPGLDEVVVETPEGVRTLRRRADGPYTVIEDTGRTDRQPRALPGDEAAAEPAPAPQPPAVTRYRTRTAAGRLDPHLLADRPVEERLRPTWTVTWAVPVAADGTPVAPATAPVLHAPTPTDEPLGVPALLIASFPLEPTRRHLAPGPLTDFLVARAADAYAGLLADWDPLTPGTIDLVPGPLGRGELDGALRAGILRLLPEIAFLPPATPEEGAKPQPLRPRDALVAEGAGAETVRRLGDVFPHLLPAGLERRGELRTLGVARVPLGELVERLAGAERPAAWWHGLYDSLAGTDPEELGGLPVPLADGRVVVGPRQVLLPAGGDAADGTQSARLARLGLRVADPVAAHPVLEQLGAVPATPRAVLTTPQVRAAVAGSLDAGEVWFDEGPEEGAPGPEELADIVLGLVRDAHLEPGDEPWLGALALPDEDGDPAPAGELVYPGSPFAAVIRPGELAVCAADLVERWGEEPLTAVGVQADFVLVRAEDVVLDPDELEPRDAAYPEYPESDDAGLLDAVDVWCEDVLDQLPDTPVPPVLTELVGVRDLDLVDDAHWPQALALLSRPPLREALTRPARVLLPDGEAHPVRPYTAWWLRGNPVLDGRPPAGLRAAGGDPLLTGLYEPADASAVGDEQVLRALGVRTSAAALLDEPGGAAELLARLADPDRDVTPGQLHALYTLLADLDPADVTLPDDLRAVRDGTTEVVPAGEALVADAPDLVPLATDRPLLPVAPARAAALGELLQVRRLTEAYQAPAARVPAAGEVREVPRPVRDLLGPDTPATYEEHGQLTVDGTELDWRRTPDGTVHAATMEGLAAGLAWATGQWQRRFEAAALLEDPTRTRELGEARWFD